MRGEKETREFPGWVATPFCLAMAFAAIWPLLKLWNRLAVPLLHAPLLTYAEMFGLVQLFRFLIIRRSPRELANIEEMSESLSICLSCYLALGLTWLLLHG